MLTFLAYYIMHNNCNNFGVHCLFYFECVFKKILNIIRSELYNIQVKSLFFSVDTINLNICKLICQSVR